MKKKDEKPSPHENIQDQKYLKNTKLIHELLKIIYKKKNTVILKKETQLGLRNNFEIVEAENF